MCDPSGPNIITGVLTGEEGRQGRVRGDVSTEAEVRERFEDATLLALIKERPWARNDRWPQEAGEAKKWLLPRTCRRKVALLAP